MHIRRYEPGDLAEMNSWYRARGLPEVLADQLPILGYFVPGVGAGFLYRTDSSIGQLDGFISNPEASSRARYLALSEIGALLTQAFTGKHLLVYTANSNVARWSREHDFAARRTHELYEFVKEGPDGVPGGTGTKRSGRG